MNQEIGTFSTLFQLPLNERSSWISIFLIRLACLAEGTTSNGEYLLPFKTGAFRAQTPVKLVILKYPYKRFSPAWESISGASSNSFGPTLVDVMAELPRYSQKCEELSLQILACLYAHTVELIMIIFISHPRPLWGADEVIWNLVNYAMNNDGDGLIHVKVVTRL